MADDDLMSVAEFAAKFQVDTSEVRRWMRSGFIPYELVGPRKMRRIRRSMAVVPIVPSLPPPPDPLIRLNELMEAKIAEEFNVRPTGTESKPDDSAANRERPDQKDAGRPPQYKKDKGRHR